VVGHLVYGSVFAPHLITKTRGLGDRRTHRAAIPGHAQTSPASRRLILSDSTVELYYDPYDHTIDDDPYPGVETDARPRPRCTTTTSTTFYALSRYDDVLTCTARLGKHIVREEAPPPTSCFSGIDIPPGNLAMGRPAACTTLPPPPVCHECSPPAACWRSKGWCVTCVRVHWIRYATWDGFELRRRSRRDHAHADDRLTCSVSPEEGQQQIRERNDKSITVESGGHSAQARQTLEESIGQFADYIEWRATHPSDDLMTELLKRTRGRNRTEPCAPSNRGEVIAYTAMIAGRGR